MQWDYKLGTGGPSSWGLTHRPRGRECPPEVRPGPVASSGSPPFLLPSAVSSPGVDLPTRDVASGKIQRRTERTRSYPCVQGTIRVVVHRTEDECLPHAVGEGRRVWSTRIVSLPRARGLKTWEQYTSSVPAWSPISQDTYRGHEWGTQVVSLPRVLRRWTGSTLLLTRTKVPDTRPQVTHTSLSRGTPIDSRSPRLTLKSEKLSHRSPTRPCAEVRHRLTPPSSHTRSSRWGGTTRVTYSLGLLLYIPPFKSLKRLHLSSRRRDFWPL